MTILNTIIYKRGNSVRKYHEYFRVQCLVSTSATVIKEYVLCKLYRTYICHASRNCSRVPETLFWVIQERVSTRSGEARGWGGRRRRATHFYGQADFDTPYNTYSIGNIILFQNCLAYLVTVHKTNCRSDFLYFFIYQKIEEFRKMADTRP